MPRDSPNKIQTHRNEITYQCLLRGFIKGKNLAWKLIVLENERAILNLPDGGVSDRRFMDNSSNLNVISKLEAACFKLRIFYNLFIMQLSLLVGHDVMSFAAVTG